MKEILLTDYWKFFGTNNFAKNSNVRFFIDGSFAIQCGNKVAVYNSQCEQLKSFDNARIFDTGCVGAIESNGNINIYSVVTDTMVDTINCNAHDFLRCTEHAFISRDVDSGLLTFYRPAHNKYEYEKMNLPYERLIDFKTSYNGMLFLNAEHEIKDKKSKRLFDKFGNPLRLETSAMVEFLDCGSYIIYDSSGASLYNDSCKKLLHSDMDFGIRNFGGYFVCYEDKLIANAKYGRIIKNVSQNELMLTPYNMSIYPYMMVGRDGIGYWLESQKMAIYPIGDNYLIGYWHDGKFYFIADSLASTSQMGQLLSLRETDDELEQYKDTISSMILHR